MKFIHFLVWMAMPFTALAQCITTGAHTSSSVANNSSLGSIPGPILPILYFPTKVIPVQDSRTSNSSTVSASLRQSGGRIFIYPNPVMTDLFIESNEPIQSATSYNSYGQMVAVTIHKRIAYRWRLNCQGLRSGIYLLHIQNKAKLERKPVVVN